MKPGIIPNTLTGKSLFDFLVKNEGLIFHAKKSQIKKADECFSVPLFVNEKGELVDKEDMIGAQVDPNKLQVLAVVNTTNWYDSHGDVHIPGLWKKSLSDNRKQGYYLLDSHQRGFKDVIAEGCKAEAISMPWKDLGMNMPGNSEALVFTCLIEKDRNEFMFGQYEKKYVKKHSVGMRYVKMVTCINDDDYPVQKENWDKYIEMVANKKDCEVDGYFWAVLEAQVVEGSAVVFASNGITPTLEVSNFDSSKNQVVPGTETQPPLSTEDQPPTKGIDWEKMADNLINSN